MKDFILKLDKNRELRFGFKAMRAIREKFGDRSFAELLNLKLDEMPQLVLIGLKWEDKQLTIDRVEDLLDAAIQRYPILDVTNLTLEALAAHMGVDTKKVTADVLEKNAKKQEELLAKVAMAAKEREKED
ncbi:unnamed protein product [marine sediment metagenome]|uniref:Uncharacterized protein n=1 Tax=marine sediment metagenome TaxID=412755 RepID=X1PKA8_9ZZZZ